MSFKLFCINSCSLNKRFDDLQQLSKSTNINYDNITISETWIMGSLEITKNIDIKNYNMKYMSNESTAAGTMLYIANLPTYKRTIDLNFYKTNEL